jgi:ferredoxin-thioredoxin reductase catalytic subunit
MSEEVPIPSQEVDALYEQLDREAEASGYHLNPDREFTRELVKGLLVNEKRYGYRSCPCRLATGDRQRDLDIICPCDYRDPDLLDWGACYCALYVSDDVLEGSQALQPVPERRGSEPQAPTEEEHGEELVGFTWAGMPVWRCKVCGYLCARPRPPHKCPICKADQDRFERFF